MHQIAPTGTAQPAPRQDDRRALDSTFFGPAQADLGREPRRAAGVRAASSG
ncbi:hypothetical protein [Amycolatopsis sp. NPDC051903]|uniref:hypothetical protein n=1 Tax=Amycolatopsis sp. NPDC051903 TaxID=3363936 RepID=UPI00379E0E2B